MLQLPTFYLTIIAILTLTGCFILNYNSIWIFSYKTTWNSIGRSIIYTLLSSEYNYRNAL